MENLKKSNELLEAIANGVAFDKETGLIWEHWLNSVTEQVEKNNLELCGGECSDESSVLPIHGVRLSLPFNDLYKELDDKRMYQHVNRSAFHLYRKQLAEHLLDNYEIYAKGERQ